MFFEENGINAPTNKEEQTTSDKDVDWRYRISNDKLREVTNTLPMTTFCQRHLCRLGNRTMQKQ